MRDVYDILSAATTTTLYRTSFSCGTRAAVSPRGCTVLMAECSLQVAAASARSPVGQLRIVCVLSFRLYVGFYFGNLLSRDPIIACITQQ